MLGEIASGTLMELIHKGRACPSPFPSYAGLCCHVCSSRSQREISVDLGIETLCKYGEDVYTELHGDAQLWIAYSRLLLYERNILKALINSRLLSFFPNIQMNLIFNNAG